MGQEKMQFDMLNDEELAKVTGANRDNMDELERCKADCEKRLANVAEIYRRKCITTCIERFKEESL
jgi:hypothetical protein